MNKFLLFIIRFCIFCLVVAIVVVTSVYVFVNSKHWHIYGDNAWDDVVAYNPLDDNQTNNIVLNSHQHTIHSDGVLTVRQAVLWNIAMGYNALFITDHNTIKNSEDIAAANAEFGDRIIIMQGMEWTTGRIHLNFLGLTEWDFEQFPIPRYPTDQEIEAAIAEAHRQGAVTVACHYVWSTSKNKPSRQQLLDWGIDYFEVINDDCYPADYYDKEAIAFAEENGLGLITGTDMHYPNFLQVDGRVRGWTLVQTDEFSEEAIMQKLRLRETEILHSETGVPALGNYPIKKGYEWLNPLSEIGRYFRGFYIGNGYGIKSIDWVPLGITMTYFIALFGVIELIRLIFKALNKS